MYYEAPAAAPAARWGARLLGGLILLFWGSFMVAHLWGEEGGPSRPLTWGDYLMLGSLVTALAGLLLAWRWELAGACLTLAAVAVCAAVNWKVLTFPGFLIPLTAALYLAAWWMGRGRVRSRGA